MKLYHHCVLFLSLFLFLGFSETNAEDTQLTKAQQEVAKTLLKKLMPLPEGVLRTIQNPYYADPAWKLWAVDDSPVTIKTPHYQGTVQLTNQKARQKPVYLLKRGVSELSLVPLGKGPESGFWDDAYMSLDNHHTRLGKPKGQFIDAGKMVTARDTETILKLGVNFTSQSYAGRGRDIVRDTLNNLNTERHFFFANCIRATPSHISFQDNDEDLASDLYEGLYSHSFHSVGQSGSEMHAIYKMMVAGACIPRTTKDLLKKHGAYAIALLTLFKSALPYADVQGQSLPYEHELRHRPAYSSHGTPSHAHYCSANVHYHGYDDKRHLRTMMDMASSMQSPPPIAVAHLVGLSVKRNGFLVTDPTHINKIVQCLSLTNIRLVGEVGETLEAQINLLASYDLIKQPLDFTCQTLYPNQKNVSIKEERKGVYQIRVKHDPKLPKGRIPVICTARNGSSVPSNPVFINFFWPHCDTESLNKLSPELRKKVKQHQERNAHVNLRPVVEFDCVGDTVRCQPGDNVSVNFEANDPEGYPVSVFQRSGQIGTLNNNRLTFTIPETDSHKIYRTHLIFSDGTGAYTGKQLKFIVNRKTDQLPPTWHTTAIGSLSRVVNVSAKDDVFTFGKEPLDKQQKSLQGTFVYQTIPDNVDLCCSISQKEAGTNTGLMITRTLDGFSRRIGIGFFDNKIQGQLRQSERSWGNQTYPATIQTSKDPYIFRLVRKGEKLVGYVSTDQKSWEQVFSSTMNLFRECYGGIIYRGGPWQEGKCQWIKDPGEQLPILIPNTSRDNEGQYQTPLEIRLQNTDVKAVLHYTVDGTEPTNQSPIYQDPIKLTKAGQHEVRVKPYLDNNAQPYTVKAVYTLNP